jgi:tRNA/rRNA methyltransferase
MIIYFVLVAPAVPENVGAAARAINTMGFLNLRLVNPCDYLCSEAKKLAHGSVSILQNAEVFSSFDKCIKDLDITIATTSKLRRTNYDYYTPSEVGHILQKKVNSVKKAGIIFGSEEHGLKNEYLRKCSFLSSIPMANPYPSLNLAQAVMIYAYCLSPYASLQKIVPEKDDLHFPIVMQKINMILDSIDIKSGSNLYTRISERLAVVNDDDLNLFSSVSTKMINKFLNKK